MPRRKQDAATTTLVLDVFEAVHEIWNAAQQAKAAETESPGTTVR
jgi:hypothetical protein